MLSKTLKEEITETTNGDRICKMVDSFIYFWNNFLEDIILAVTGESQGGFNLE
ncbi:MAG: hypothetical protein ACFFEJ_13295 [Candidatus Thorarchaeota archaeon]